MLVRKYSASAVVGLSVILVMSLLSVPLIAAQTVNRDDHAHGEVGGSPADEAVADLNKQLEDQRAKIDAIVEKINQYRQSIQSVQKQGATLRNQMSIIDNQIAKTDLDIDSKEEEVKIIELEIEKLRLEIAEQETLIDRDKQQLAAIVRLISRYDDRSYLSVLLGNNSFSEFFDQLKYSADIQEDMQNTLDRVQELVTKLTTQQAELDTKRENLTELLETLENEKSSLDAQKGQKQYLISQTKQSETKFQALIKDLQREQAAVNAQVAGLERQIRDRLQKAGKGERFNSLGNAVLAWPTTIRRITAHFHDSDYPFKATIGEHSGTDIGLPQGTPLYAAEAGYVGKAAVGTKWYGTYLMIIHSNNLSTLYGHMSSLAVSADQYVTKGQLIGYSGNTGFSSGPHLHFEVRLNGIPVNALNYLP